MLRERAVTLRQFTGGDEWDDARLMERAATTIGRHDSQEPTHEDMEALARAIHDSERTWPAYGDEEFKSIWRDQAREVLSWLHENGWRKTHRANEQEEG